MVERIDTFLSKENHRTTQPHILTQFQLDTTNYLNENMNLDNIVKDATSIEFIYRGTELKNNETTGAGQVDKTAGYESNVLFNTYFEEQHVVCNERTLIEDPGNAGIISKCSF